MATQSQNVLDPAELERLRRANLPFPERFKETVTDVAEPITEAMQAVTEPIAETFENNELRAAAIGWVTGVVSTLLTFLVAHQIH